MTYFVSECPLNVSLFQLGSGVKCHIPDICTGVHCCVDVAVVGRSFHAFAVLDACNLVINVGIENLKFDLNLDNYEWGE